MKRLVSPFLILLFTTLLIGCATLSPSQNQPSKAEKTQERIDELRTTIVSLRHKLEAEQEELESVRESLQEKTRTLRFKNEKLESRNETLEEQLGTIGESRARREGGNVVLTLPERVLFDLGEVNLHQSARDTLQQLGTVLKDHPDRFIVVEGHADTVPVDPEWHYSSNWDLSAMRASNVVEYLTEETPVRADRIIAAGYGDQHPIVPNTSEANRRKNRRVEIVLYPPDLPRKELNLSK
jgi:chemotaxis protein MotB